MTVRHVVLLGSTGSIGTQAIDIVRRNPDRFRVVGVGGQGSNVALLAAQALELQVEVVGVAKASAVQDLQLAFYAEAAQRGYATGEFKLPKIVAGPQAMAELAQWPCDVVLNGVDVDRWVPGPGGEDLVWFGRLVPEKAPHDALRIAAASGRRVRLAGPAPDRAYFDDVLRPLLGPGAEYVGHLGVDDLVALVGSSASLSAARATRSRPVRRGCSATTSPAPTCSPT